MPPLKVMTTSPRVPSPRTEEPSGGGNESGDVAVLRLLGLARRAGSLVTGSEAVKGAVRSGSLSAVVFARDASANAVRRIEPALARQGIRSSACGDRAALGAALGKGPIVVVGITDAALARAVLSRLEAGRR